MNETADKLDRIASAISKTVYDHDLAMSKYDRQRKVTWDDADYLHKLAKEMRGEEGQFAHNLGRKELPLEATVINPVIHDNLTAIFNKHYNMTPRKAAEASLKFMEIMELYRMQIIIGDWVIPDVVELSPFEMMVKTQKETMEREPWLAREIQ